MNARLSTLAAVDLGAASGRVMTGQVGPGTLRLAEVARVPNVPVRAGGTLQSRKTALSCGFAAFHTAESGLAAPASPSLNSLRLSF